MDAVTPTRKSGRQRVPNKKYSVDAFESLDILGSDNEHDAEQLRKSERRAARDDTEGHDDFSDDDPVVVESSVEDDDEMSARESPNETPLITPEESDDEAVDSDDVAETDPSKPRRKKQPYALVENVRSRGMNEHSLRIARANDWQFIEHICGSSKADQELFQQKIRDRWGSITALPTKQMNQHGVGGMDYAPKYTAEQREMEATVGWDWYYDEGGKATFQAKQVLESLRADLGTLKYVPRPAKGSHSVLMGPYPKQKLFTIPLFQCLKVDEAWSTARMAHAADADSNEQTNAKRRQDGWVLNVGTAVHCLEWAPNHKDTQYLAVSTLPSKEPRNEQPASAAPAYTASGPNPSCVQIWALRPSEDHGTDLTLPPELRMMICTEWGCARQLKWCPMPRDPRDSDPDMRTYIGLLAGVWNDGYVRVLDVYLEDQEDSKTKYVKYTTAAFASKPPETLCTCVTWLSPTDIAVGCANGYLAIWNIYPRNPPQTQSQPPNPNKPQALPRPYNYIPLHHSYILAITTAYPPYPHFLASSSISGHIRLTDLRSPTADSVYAQHTRYGPSSLSYSPHLYCFTSTHEDGNYIKGWPLRRFWGAVGLARGDSELLSISAAPLHPTVICGYADGTLMAFNPLKRYMGGKVRGAQPQLKVWKQEWAARPGMRGEEGEGGRDGISRFTEGYKLDHDELNPNGGEKRGKGFQNNRIDELSPKATVYEAESGVRNVVWNPNLGWGGWVAAGMGSGLVRVEDLSL